MDDLQVIQNMPEGTVLFYSNIGAMTGKTKKKAATIQFLIDDDQAQEIMRALAFRDDCRYHAFCVIFENNEFDKIKANLTKK